jgi:hypothetical protein
MPSPIPKSEIGTEHGCHLLASGQIAAGVTIHANAATVLRDIQRHRLVVFAADALFGDVAGVRAAHAPLLRTAGESDVESGIASARIQFCRAGFQL